jgi:predicted phosphodiesterase
VGPPKIDIQAAKVAPNIILANILRNRSRVKIAILSDIHSNLASWRAVLNDIKSQGIDRIICLGDVVGYGPNPCECINLVQKNCDVCLLGNHDQGALFDPEGFNVGAERAIFWTRDQLEYSDADQAQADSRWEYLGELPRKYQQDDMLFVHGSPRNPLNEYVFPEDTYNRTKMEKLFALVQKVSFQGHTHVPGVFTEDLRFFSPEEIDEQFEIGDQKILVNVGSVGQPRDGDPRACYVTLDENLIRFHRVEYPVEETVEQIHAIDELDNFLGDRLREGR